MKHKDIEKEYELLMTQLMEGGGLDIGTGEDERRKHQRFKTQPDTFLAYMNSQFTLIDASKSGLCFYSNHPYQPGQTVKMELDEYFSVEAEVVNCQQAESDPDSLEELFSVHCKFLTEDHGMHLLMKLRDGGSLDLPRHSG